MSDAFPILFTIEHAQQVLSRIRPTVADMVRAYRGLQALTPAGRDWGDTLARNGGSRPSAEAFALMTRLQRALVTIRSEGVLVQDVARGLLDFPAQLEGRIVFLCWMHGEGEIGFWHEKETGFAGRLPLGEV
jgi:hypothetical protein